MPRVRDYTFAVDLDGKRVEVEQEGWNKQQAEADMRLWLARQGVPTARFTLIKVT